MYLPGNNVRLLFESQPRLILLRRYLANNKSSNIMFLPVFNILPSNELLLSLLPMYIWYDCDIFYVCFAVAVAGMLLHFYDFIFFNNRYIPLSHFVCFACIFLNVNMYNNKDARVFLWVHPHLYKSHGRTRSHFVICLNYFNWYH